MPESIASVHAVFLLIAFGILIGFGWALITMAVQWPAGRISGIAALCCVLLLIIAWLV